MRKYIIEFFEDIFSTLFDEKGAINDFDGYAFLTITGIIMCLSGLGFTVVNNSFGKSILMLLFFTSLMLLISALDYGEKENSKWQKSKEEQKKRNEQYTAQRYYPAPHANRY